MTPLAALSPNSDFVTACYIVAFSLFIFGIQQGTHPRTGPTRQPDRRGRDARRDRDHALHGRDRQWRPDPDRNPDRDRGRRCRLPPSADDRHAADGRALQRRGRRRRGADLLVGVPARLGRRLEHPARHLRPDPVLHGDRLGLLLGIEHRLRQAPGDHPEPARSVPRSANRQRAAPRRDPRRLHRPGHRPRLAVAGSLHRRPDCRGRARQPLRAADRRGGHARGDLAAQRLHRPRGGRGGVRPGQRRPDRRRRAGRVLGNHPHPRDEPRDEPLDLQPSLLGLWGRERVRGGEGGAARSLDRGRGCRDQARLRRLRRLRPRLRHGGRAGTARGQGARQRAREAWGQRQLRDPSGRGPDARPHERPAG